MVEHQLPKLRVAGSNRTLDPPLHEFLPQDEAGIAELARATGKPIERVRTRIEELHESNPMLGHRGCRLGISYPEITEMQARAIFEAACDLDEKGHRVEPVVMIPLVGVKKELDDQTAVVRRAAEEVFRERGRKVTRRHTFEGVLPNLERRWRETDRQDREIFEALVASVNGISQGLQGSG